MFYGSINMNAVLLIVYSCAITGIFSGAISSTRTRKLRCTHTNNQNNLNSFLWTLKRPNSPPSYFFGTIHVPYTRVWDFIPENTKKAFKESDYVFFELDLTDSFTIIALTNCQLLPNGQKLSNILPRDMYRRLKSHFEYVKKSMPSWMSADQRGRGIYPEFLFNAIAGNWEQKRPVWVMLMVNALTEADIRSKGIPVLDLYLAREADKMNKRTGAVEKVEEQCIPLNDLNVSQVLFALNQTLWQHESYRVGMGTVQYTTDDLINHYNCGDLNSVIFTQETAQIPKIVNNRTVRPQELKMAHKIDEYFRNELIYKRNARMAERVAQLLEQHPKKSLFFAFGAGHFLGNNTILDHLRKKGYTIEHTKPNEKIFINKKNHNRQNRRNKKSRRPGGRRRHGRRKKNKHSNTKNKKKINFNELWVRLETSTTPTTTPTTTTTSQRPTQQVTSASKGPMSMPTDIDYMIRTNKAVSISPNTFGISLAILILHICMR